MDHSNPGKYLGNELENLGRVLRAESWSATGGSWTQALEREFARTVGARYGVAMNSGTAALHAALLACGVEAGDEVISPALTVIMNTTSTFHANAIPVYADVDDETLTLDPGDIERRITPRTRAIMAVSLYGLPCSMDPIMAIASRHGVAVIEDNAQCVRARYKDRPLGTIGRWACYSFENTKHLSCGEGGLLLTDNDQLAERARKVAGHGFRNLTAAEGRIRLNDDVFQRPDYKRHDTLGWNYRMSEFNAAVALAQLERIDELLETRMRSAALFLAAMEDCPYLRPQRTPADRTHSYYTLAVRFLGEEQAGVSWDRFRRTYLAEGGDGIYGAWSVPYLEPLMVERQYVRHNPTLYRDLRFSRGSCPVAERVQGQMMQFKTNYRDLALAEQKAEALARTIRKLI